MVGTVGHNGFLKIDQEMLAPMEPGKYSAHFLVRAYYMASFAEAVERTFLDVARFDFLVSDPDIHIHFPFKFSPWGFSLFRGNP